MEIRKLISISYLEYVVYMKQYISAFFLIFFLWNCNAFSQNIYIGVSSGLNNNVCQYYNFALGQMKSISIVSPGYDAIIGKNFKNRVGLQLNFGYNKSFTSLKVADEPLFGRGQGFAQKNISYNYLQYGVLMTYKIYQKRKWITAFNIGLGVNTLIWESFKGGGLNVKEQKNIDGVDYWLNYSLLTIAKKDYNIYSGAGFSASYNLFKNLLIQTSLSVKLGFTTLSAMSINYDLFQNSLQNTPVRSNSISLSSASGIESRLSLIYLIQKKK